MNVQVSDEVSRALTRSKKDTYKGIGLEGDIVDHLLHLHVLNIVVLRENALIIRGNDQIVHFSSDDVEIVYHRHGLVGRRTKWLKEFVNKYLRRNDCGCK